MSATATPEAVEVITRVCAVCTRRNPLSTMHRVRDGLPSARTWRCASCFARAESNRDSLLPDPEPARRLRALLADDRRQGFAFVDAWRMSVPEVMGSLPARTQAERREREQWWAAFTSQREAWRAAYEGEPPTRRVLSPSLLDAFDG